MLWAALVVLAALSVYLIPRNPANVLLRPPGGDPRDGRSAARPISLNRAVSIERAVRIFYDSSGRYPRSLEDLVVAGILEEDALRDPYGRFYRYILRAEDGKFGLYGRNAARPDRPRPLARAQPRAGLRAAAGALAAGREQTERPSVQVVE